MKRFLFSIQVKLTLAVVTILFVVAILSVVLVIPFVETVLSPVGIGLVLLLSIVLDAIFITFAARFITRPLEEIRHMAGEVTAGRLEARTTYTSRDEIGALAADMNRMAESLESVDRLRQEFVTNVSHEFKTPLSSIQGYAELLQQEDFSRDEQREFAGVIESEAARLHQLASRLLQLSRIETESTHEQATTFDLAEQIRQVLLTFEPFCRQNPVELDIELEPVTITSQQRLLVHVWQNLVDNAFVASPSGSVITVRLWHDERDGRAVVRVHNVGHIPLEAQERIFERFYQVDTSRTRDGAGLGLAIVREILMQVGGEIKVSSSVEAGVTFEVRV
ncbi:HAMP domain-containing protein [Paenalkalicoccus suaedae]|uniref:histidine kinase n=1 Tax=Paenalkalicoccus suaedae TaxID=2592382 RepID=A0A859FIQ1_9BACI|nr:HAMP domain-containing sensor histidine kinase [Paenalkalicoccus suaedae]QKS72664.1 HAMP domain-containing protein [Paenalkalicoccus suaedae]